MELVSESIAGVAAPFAALLAAIVLWVIASVLGVSFAWGRGKALLRTRLATAAAALPLLLNAQLGQILMWRRGA
jgi:hypothetical protein